MALMSLSNLGYGCMASGGGLMAASFMPASVDPTHGAVSSSAMFFGGVGLTALGAGMSVAGLGSKK
jgi:hypothetical protein